MLAIREGVLLIRPDTTLADIRKFGEECQRRWGITPLQIFLHKDEGHWLSGQPEAGDRESFKSAKDGSSRITMPISFSTG